MGTKFPLISLSFVIFTVLPAYGFRMPRSFNYTWLQDQGLTLESLDEKISLKTKFIAKDFHLDVEGDVDSVRITPTWKGFESEVASLVIRDLSGKDLFTHQGAVSDEEVILADGKLDDFRKNIFSDSTFEVCLRLGDDPMLLYCDGPYIWREILSKKPSKKYQPTLAFNGQIVRDRGVVQRKPKLIEGFEIRMIFADGSRMWIKANAVRQNDSPLKAVNDAVPAKEPSVTTTTSTTTTMPVANSVKQ